MLKYDLSWSMKGFKENNSLSSVCIVTTDIVLNYDIVISFK